MASLTNITCRHSVGRAGSGEAEAKRTGATVSVGSERHEIRCEAESDVQRRWPRNGMVYLRELQIMRKSCSCIVSCLVCGSLAAINTHVIASDESTGQNGGGGDKIASKMMKLNVRYVPKRKWTDIRGIKFMRQFCNRANFIFRPELLASSFIYLRLFCFVCAVRSAFFIRRMWTCRWTLQALCQTDDGWTLRTGT